MPGAARRLALFLVPARKRAERNRPRCAVLRIPSPQAPNRAAAQLNLAALGIQTVLAFTPICRPRLGAAEGDQKPGHCGRSAFLLRADRRIASNLDKSSLTLFYLPASFVLDREGKIRFVEFGYTTGIGLRARLWLAGF